jgi:hypothetical protein
MSQVSDPAGEVEFNGITDAFPAPVVITFEAVSSPAFTPVSFDDVVLEPSSSLFDMPEPGILRYVGDGPARFRVTYNLVGDWLDGPSSTKERGVMVTVLLVNGGVDSTALWLNQLQRTLSNDFSISSHHGQALRVLQTGDELQIGILFGQDIPPVPGTIEFAVFSLSLLATKD